MKPSLSDDGKGALYACENCEWRGEAVLGGEWRGEPVLGSECPACGALAHSAVQYAPSGPVFTTVTRRDAAQDESTRAQAYQRDLYSVAPLHHGRVVPGGSITLRLHADGHLVSRAHAAQITRYGEMVDRYGRPTGWLYSANVGERAYFVRGTVTTAKRRSGCGWHEVATWHTTGPRIYTLQIGDRIKVRGMSASLGMQTAWHTIQSLDPITVRVDGLADYLVRPRDVLESEVHSS
jgi:hypothetical protein